MPRTHKDLGVWKKSINFVTSIYKVTKSFPREELNGLVSQIRRASVSIPSNIAEGAVRKGKQEFRQFLHIALSSAAEVDTQLVISRNLDFISEEEFRELSGELDSISKMTQGLIKSLDK